MSITIVIPTHDRYEQLRNLLASIQKHGGKEIASVIVVDDSGSKQTVGNLEGIALEHIKVDYRIFISKAKNIGWRRSTTEFVYFIDDDNVLGKSTVIPLMESMSRFPSLGAVMPAVLYRRRKDLVWVYATPFLNRRLDLNLVGRNQPRNQVLENRLLNTDALPNASLVRRDSLTQVNGFDERLVVNSSLDFCQRLKSNGWRVACNTGAFIFHDVELPGRLGWWAVHGSADPDRVRFELRDWFVIMEHLHRGERFLVLRLIVKSLSFVLPNLLAYFVQGRSKSRLLRSLIRGYAEGIGIVERAQGSTSVQNEAGKFARQVSEA